MEDSPSADASYTLILFARTGVSDGWCMQGQDKVAVMAQDVVAKGYGGIFYWPNVEAALAVPIYTATYAMMK